MTTVQKFQLWRALGAANSNQWWAMQRALDRRLWEFEARHGTELRSLSRYVAKLQEQVDRLERKLEQMTVVEWTGRDRGRELALRETEQELMLLQT